MYAPLTEEQARQQWLASLDAPAWGQAASAMSEVRGESARACSYYSKSNHYSSIATAP